MTEERLSNGQVHSVKGCACVSNAVVYGLEDSIRRAKFPMSTDVDSIIGAEEMSYWLKDNFLHDFIEYLDSGKYPKYILTDECAKLIILRKNKEEVEILLDEEDIPLIFPYDWHFDGEYCKSNAVGSLHRFILKNYLKENEDLVVDHINHNTKDNRKLNLRLSSYSNNSYNAIIRKNNQSGIMGVNWEHRKNKWRAYINQYGKQIFIGYFNSFKDAARARLIKEREICGAFAPQRNLFSLYGIEEVKTIGINKTYFRLKDAIAAYKNLKRLSASQKGEGHDQALTGIIVQFDLTFSNKAWVELERYHFIDFVSSQSTMHRITKFNLKESYNEYVDSRIVEIMEEKVKDYNRCVELNKECPDIMTNDILAKKYLGILYSNPAGFMLTAGMTTNYRQLKTIYSQRKNHKLPEWKTFCKWIETLPHSELICNCYFEK